MVATALSLNWILYLLFRANFSCSGKLLYGSISQFITEWVAGAGTPVVILNWNQPAFYCVFAELYERILDAMPRSLSAAICEERNWKSAVKIPGGKTSWRLIAIYQIAAKPDYESLVLVGWSGYERQFNYRCCCARKAWTQWCLHFYKWMTQVDDWLTFETKNWRWEKEFIRSLLQFVQDFLLAWACVPACCQKQPEFVAIIRCCPI